MSIFESKPVRAAIVGAILWAIPATALEASAKKGPAEPAPGSSVEMPYLIAPLTDGDTLVAYAYISSKVVASSPGGAIDVRDKIAFIQDAFVRDVNRASIGKADAPLTVDRDTLATRLLADAQKVMKPGAVVGVQIIDVQIRAVHPEPINPGGPS
ncbi:MAG TPA: hypothetical protein VL971_06150 [Rhizomicrobium sp.]|nr:hypothetical protein [Rhizomicrobium sp.]